VKSQEVCLHYPSCRWDLPGKISIDAALLSLEQRHARARHSSSPLKPALIRTAARALDRLQLPEQPSRRVIAHLLLRRADLLRIGCQQSTAIDAYERLTQIYPDQRAFAAQAKFRLGGLFSQLKEPQLLASYYLTQRIRSPISRSKSSNEHWFLPFCLDEILELRKTGKLRQVSPII
jgi:hypothetical protein